MALLCQRYLRRQVSSPNFVCVASSAATVRRIEWGFLVICS